MDDPGARPVRGRDLAALLTLLAAVADDRGSAPRDPRRRGDDGLSQRIGRLAGSFSSGVLEGVDPNEFVARLDLDAALARIDVAELVRRVDPDDVVERVDVNALLDRVDVNRLLDRVDVDRLLDRVDVDRLLSRADVRDLVRRAEIGEIISESTGQVAGTALDVVRRQAVGLDVVLTEGLFRLTGRDPDELPAGPSRLVGDRTGTAPTDGPAQRGYEVSGHYAGPVTRLAANVADVAGAIAAFTSLTAGVGYIATNVFGLDFNAQQARSGWLWLVLLALWLIGYSWVSLAVAGRTLAMTVLGLRVVARDGSPLTPRRALVRTLLLPVSALLFGAGFLGLLFDRERRGLHDLVAGSTVVYDWGDRTASVPTPLGRWLERRQGDGSA